MQGQIMGPLFLFGFLVIPALGFTAALVIKPLVEAIVQLRESFARTSQVASQERITSLESELQELRDEVHRLRTEVAFDRQLVGRGDSSAKHPKS